MGYAVLPRNFCGKGTNLLANDAKYAPKSDLFSVLIKKNVCNAHFFWGKASKQKGRKKCVHFVLFFW